MLKSDGLLYATGGPLAPGGPKTLEFRRIPEMLFPYIKKQHLNW